MKSPPWAVRMASARPMCAPASLRGNALLRMDLPRTSPALVIHPSQRHGALPLALRMRHEVILAGLVLADTRARPARRGRPPGARRSRGAGKNAVTSRQPR